jgi:phospholipase C
LRFLISLFAFFLSTTASQANADDSSSALTKINHIIVIYLENHSFDNLYGLFPNANGLAQATNAPLQTGLDGKPYEVLPATTDSRFPKDLPNQPFLIEKYVSINEKTNDLVHRFYQNQAQINGGLNDKFVAVSDAASLVMGYYDGSQLPLWQYAKKYTLADNFYQGAFGGSFLNHFWLICACTPRYVDAPESIRISLDAKGQLVKDGSVTPDGYAVNTIQPTSIPFKSGVDPLKRLPIQNTPTIGDRLTEKNISWAWYAGGWTDAVKGHPDKEFQYHHQPFGYFKNFTEGTSGRQQHLKDASDFIADIQNGTLPAVSFYKPLGEFNEHPGYADVLSGDQHVAEIVNSIEHSELWKDSVIIVTYDENGGFWDHASPPVKDRWGPGTRVPTLIISPYAKRGFVDHTEYDTTSILKLIETRFAIKPLGSRDAEANDLSNAFIY